MRVSLCGRMTKGRFDSKKRLTFGENAVSASVVALFIAACRMLSVGKGETAESWQGTALLTLAALGVTLLAIPVLSMAAESVFDESEKDSVISMIIRYAIFIAASAAAMYVALTVLGDAVDFVGDAVKIETDKRVTAAVILSVSAYMASLGARAIRKFGLVAFAFVFVTSTLLLALSFASGGSPADSLLPLISREAFDQLSHVNAILDRLLSVFAPSVIAAVWLASVREGRGGNTVKGSLLGTLFGGALLLICFLTVAVTPGLSYASLRELPYLSSVGSMSVGKLFMRPEGVVYVSYLWSVWTVLSVCLSTVKRTLFARTKEKKQVIFAAAAVLFVLYLFLG